MLDHNLLTANDFIGVRAGLVHKLGGDGNRALVLTRIFYRADARWREAHEGDDLWWWRATYATIAEETGLSDQQVRRCVRWLIDEGHLEAREFRHDGITDRTLSFRVITDLSESTVDVSDSTPQSVSESTDQSVSNSTDLPFLQTEKTFKTHDGPKTREQIDRVFQLFWTAYPRHIARAAAVKAFDKALVKASASVIIEGAGRYRRHVGDSDPKFVAHPATWLNQERWEDDYSAPAGAGIDGIRRL